MSIPKIAILGAFSLTFLMIPMQTGFAMDEEQKGNVQAGSPPSDGRYGQKMVVQPDIKDTQSADTGIAAKPISKYGDLKPAPKRERRFFPSGDYGSHIPSTTKSPQ